MLHVLQSVRPFERLLSLVLVFLVAIATTSAVMAQSGLSDSQSGVIQRSQPREISTAPPAAPSGLTATPSELSTIRPTVILAWTDNSTDEEGFYVERVVDNPAAPAPPPEWFYRIAVVPAGSGSGGSVTWVDNTVEAKTYYRYRVQAYNAAGTSAYCGSPIVLTPGVLPEAPARLRVGDATTSSLTLTWTHEGTLESETQGYTVERSTDGVNWTPLPVSLPWYALTFTDTNLNSKTSYHYRVQAWNRDGESGYSNTDRGKTR